MNLAVRIGRVKARIAIDVIIREIIWRHRQAVRVAAIPAMDETDRADIANRARAVTEERDALFDLLRELSVPAHDRLYAEISDCRLSDTAEGAKIGLRESAGVALPDSGHAQNVGGA